MHLLHFRISLFTFNTNLSTGRLQAEAPRPHRVRDMNKETETNRDLHCSKIKFITHMIRSISQQISPPPSVSLFEERQYDGQGQEQQVARQEAGAKGRQKGQGQEQQGLSGDSGAHGSILGVADLAPKHQTRTDSSSSDSE